MFTAGRIRAIRRLGQEAICKAQDFVKVLKHATDLTDQFVLAHATDQAAFDEVHPFFCA